MRISQKAVETWLQQAEDKYQSLMTGNASLVRRQIIIPYCDKNNYKFVSGMGGYSFYDKSSEPVDASEEVENVLSLDTMHGSLGEWIEDYTPDSMKKGK